MRSSAAELDLISKVVKTMFTTQLNDSNILKGINDKIINIFIKRNEIGQKQQKITSKYTKEFPGSGFSKNELGSTKIYKHFKSVFHSGNPTYDNIIWEYNSLNHFNAAPKFLREITKSTIRTSTAESLSEYTSLSRRLKRGETYFWANAAVSAARDLRLFGIHIQKHKKMTISEAVKLSVKNTASGYPHYCKKTDKKSINDVTKWLNNLFKKPTLYSMYNNLLMKNPLVIYYRFQPKILEKENDYEIKTREVWCVPHRIIALEIYFFGNTIISYGEWNKKCADPITPTGLRNVEISRKIVRSLRSRLGTKNGYNMYSMDYSKFDRTIPLFFIDLFFSIYENSRELTQIEKKIFSLLRFYTKYSPIVYQDTLFIKKKGIASGTYLTNYFDSFVNLTIWYASRQLTYMSNKEFENLAYDNNVIMNNCAMSSIKFNSEKRSDISICGDDSILYTTKTEIYVNQCLCKYLGMKIEPKFINNNKETEEIFYLGRYWNYLSEPVQTELYLFVHLIFKERWFKKLEGVDISEELTPMRMLSICCPFANGFKFLEKYFSKLEIFRKFIYNKNKFLYIKDWPNEGYIWMSMDTVYDWKLF